MNNLDRAKEAVRKTGKPHVIYTDSVAGAVSVASEEHYDAIAFNDPHRYRTVHYVHPKAERDGRKAGEMGLSADVMPERFNRGRAPSHAATPCLAV